MLPCDLEHVAASISAVTQMVGKYQLTQEERAVLIGEAVILINELKQSAYPRVEILARSPWTEK